MYFHQLVGSAMNTSSIPHSSVLSLSSKSGVASSISTLIILKKFEWDFSDVKINC